jgi:hypothetical protein
MSNTRIAWKDSIWFADIDDTLIDTEGASLLASEGVRQVFIPHCGEDKATEIKINFNAVFKLVVQGYRVRHVRDWQNVDGGKQAFDEVMNVMTALQLQVQKEYGHIKKWSREIYARIAAEKAGVSVTSELIQAAGDAYWITLTEQVTIFPDALRLTNTIAEHGRPLYLVTSSDARLIMQPDGQFTYDPAYSEALKRSRIELLRSRGLRFNTVSIGDPEDKPHVDFFMKPIKVAEAELGHPIDYASAIMLGDSFGGDLQTPKEQLGFGLVVLRERNHTLQVDDEHQLTVGNLGDVAQFLS